MCIYIYIYVCVCVCVGACLCVCVCGCRYVRALMNGCASYALERLFVCSYMRVSVWGVHVAINKRTEELIKRSASII